MRSILLRRPLRDSVAFGGGAFPALKRWANNHCAYGAGWLRIGKGLYTG
jgi:hypothetical protein